MGGRVSASWRGGGLLTILALQVLSEYHRLEGKPPVTAALLLVNTLIYLRWPAPLHHLLPSMEEVCFNPHRIVKNRDFKRFFLSAFYHVGEPHLFYNMTSLLWKGIQMETSMGSIKFASMVAALLTMSQGITLLLAKILLLFFDYETAYYYENAVGFSGVLFAMKVVLNSQSDDYRNVHGIIVPSRYAAWAELIVIQLFVPGVSFLGHLGGILAGIFYLRTRDSYSGSDDPLTSLIRGVTRMVSWPVRFVQGMFQFRHRRISGRGTVGGSRQPGRGMSGVWRCPSCTYDNSGWNDVCDMCGTERSGLGFSSWPPPSDIYHRDLSVEELRRRRLERFAREY